MAGDTPFVGTIIVCETLTFTKLVANPPPKIYPRAANIVEYMSAQDVNNTFSIVTSHNTLECFTDSKMYSIFSSFTSFINNTVLTSPIWIDRTVPTPNMAHPIMVDQSQPFDKTF